MAYVCCRCKLLLRFVLTKENNKKLFKKYKKLLEEHEDTLSELLTCSIELSSIYSTVEQFVEKHNSCHDRKIDFYYDKGGWHCCYCDEKPRGDVVTEQEEIMQQNENNDENQG